MNRISELKQEAIIILLENNYSIRELVELFNISKGTARRYYTLYWDAVCELEGEGAIYRRKGGYREHRKHIEIQKKHINRRID